jgi:hypothetical protein
VEEIDLKEALADATPIDRLELLFGMLGKLIRDCATRNDQGQDSIDPALVVEVIEVIDFLRAHLRPDHPSAFNMAFRKFYRDLNRLMIDANHEGCRQKLDQSRKAIAKLLGPMLGHDFLRNCQDESLFESFALETMLLHLHELTFRSQIGSSKRIAAPAFVTLH